MVEVEVFETNARNEKRREENGKFTRTHFSPSFSITATTISNGVVSLSLVRDILQARPNCVVLFIPAEIVTSALYIGHDRARMITNALFRAGGAAAVLTNRRDLKHRAKYRLLHQERVHTGASDVAFKAMYYGPDEEGHTGIALTKDIPPEAAKAIEKVLRVVTPKMLTSAQKLSFTKHFLKKKVLGGSSGSGSGSLGSSKGKKEQATTEEKDPPHAPRPKPEDEWQPDYTQCIDHFILHAGGYGVLKGIQKGMRLPSDVLLPSFATLRDIGNTSSSSTWYTFAYLESVSKGVKRGERLLQLGVGGGMKAAAAVWQCLRDSKESHPVWDHLERRPVEHHELPRKIDETREAAAAITAEVARDSEALAAARDAERNRKRAEAAALPGQAGAGAAVAPEDDAASSTGALRADSALDDELERALPRPGSFASEGKGLVGLGGGVEPARAVEA